MIFAVSCHLVIIAQISLAHNPENFVTIANVVSTHCLPSGIGFQQQKQKNESLEHSYLED